MNKGRLVVLLFLLTTQIVTGQQPADILDKWGSANPIKKVYLHFDRDNYFAGQTLWFKAYFYSDYFPDDNSTTLFVEFLNDKSVIIKRQIFPAFKAVSQGQIELTDSLPTGDYMVRAYTASMLNQDADFVFKKKISVTGKKNKAAVAQNAGREIRMEFFPEGGNFVAGHPNTIAFKATLPNGLPAEVKGVIKNTAGEIQTEFSSYHDGMGLFDIEAVQTGYYAELKDDAGAKKYPLPTVETNACVFRLLNGNGQIHFEIFGKKDDPVFQPTYMVGQMQHHVVFRQGLKPGMATINGTIDVSHLASGVLQITLFNRDGLPLAERLLFINNKEYIRKAELKIDTLNTDAFGKNHFTVQLKDTVLGSFSVSVTDADFDLSAMRSENIYSSLLLTTDLKGYIHNPSYYFSSDEDSVSLGLDLVMMTNGWRRFSWKELLKNPAPPSRFKEPEFITLSGKVNIEGTRKPMADKSLLLFVTPPDSSKIIQLIKTDAEGNFKLDSVLFFGKSWVMIKDTRGNKSKFLEVIPGADSLTKLYPVPLLRPDEWQPSLLFGANELERQKKLEAEYENIMKASGLVLAGVTVKARKKTQQELLEEKYVSNLFAGNADKIIDLVNSDEATPYNNIFDYLQSRIPGLQVTVEEFDYTLYYRQSTSISSMGSIPMTLFLDEVETASGVISSIPANQVAMVKLYNTFVGASGNGAGGVLAIYTKKGSDLYNTTNDANRYTSQGYSVIKEFYSPDYSVKTEQTLSPDNRLTLYWSPDFFVRGVNVKLPVVFYNNSRTKRFRIVAEGMSTDGKMLMLETVVSPKGF